MADLTCGAGGSTGSEIIAQINENTARMEMLTVLAQVDPRGSLRLSTDTTQTITDSAIPDLLECFDTIVTSQNGFIPKLTGNTATITNDSGYNSKAIVSVGLNVDFPANETLEVFLFVNGVVYSDVPLLVQGNGNGKPISMYWESEVVFADGDVLDIRGRNADTGTYDIKFLRSTLRITASWREMVTLPVQPTP